MNLPLSLLAILVLLKISTIYAPLLEQPLSLILWPFAIFVLISVINDIFININRTIPTCYEGDIYCEIQRKIVTENLTQHVFSIALRSIIVIVTFLWFLI
ncbi:MAG: hypothetical protein AB1782_15110 [Cyanobacteriota bacterium]